MVGNRFKLFITFFSGKSYRGETMQYIEHFAVFYNFLLISYVLLTFRLILIHYNKTMEFLGVERKVTFSRPIYYE